MVVFFDFYKHVSLKNIKKIIVFTENEGIELRNKYPLKSRFGLDKIDLARIPGRFVFKSINDLKTKFLKLENKHNLSS